MVEPPASSPRPSARLVVEFAGTPRAGKTSAMHGLRQRLEDRGRSVLLVDGEPAMDPPLPTRHPRFNLWAATATSARVIEAVHAEADIVLVDKGLFDALCWMNWHRRHGSLSAYDHEAIAGFLRVGVLRELIHLVFVMTVAPAVAVHRERASWPTGANYQDGTVVNRHTLGELNKSIATMVQRHRREFKLIALDTTKMSREEALDIIVARVESLAPGQASPPSVQPNSR